MDERRTSTDDERDRACGSPWAALAIVCACIVALTLLPGPSPSARGDAAAAGKRDGHRATVGSERAGSSQHRRGGRNATYKVDGDQLLGNPGARALRYWERFVTLVPAGERAHVRRFTLFGGAFADAFVTPLQRNPGLWKLGVFKRLEPRFVDVTLVHEFAHLMTLKAEQVPPSRGGKRRCETYFPGEGCALPDSYLAQYVGEFWQRTGRLDEWKQARRKGRGAVRDFHRRYRDEFVTNYASSHPAEDIAESFAAFVIDGGSDRGAVADAKVRFFDRFPELVELREHMREVSPQL